MDMEIVHKAIQTLVKSEEGKHLTGFGADFALMLKTEGGLETYLTTLVEVNDGYSLGWYEGVSAKDYTDLLIARWQTLVTEKR